MNNLLILDFDDGQEARRVDVINARIYRSKNIFVVKGGHRSGFTSNSHITESFGVFRIVNVDEANAAVFGIRVNESAAIGSGRDDFTDRFRFDVGVFKRVDVGNAFEGFRIFRIRLLGCS